MTLSETKSGAIIRAYVNACLEEDRTHNDEDEPILEVEDIGPIYPSQVDEALTTVMEDGGVS